MHTIRRDPQEYGYDRSRWTLTMVIETLTWLELNSRSGICKLLKRLGIRWKMGRDYVHSPDKHYNEKLGLIELAKQFVYAEPDRYVLLYLDELSYYRQPEPTFAYESVGKVQPLARRSYHSNTRSRVIGALDLISGKVLHRQRSKIGVREISEFYQEIANEYANADTIFVVQDNWPIHFHPDVLARLQPQEFSYPPNLPKNWPKEPSRKAVHDDLPIQILCLPTYASWCNPIEKLWRWLRQDILYLHRQSDEWPELKQRVSQFLYRFRDGSPELLQYTGLSIRDGP